MKKPSLLRALIALAPLTLALPCAMDIYVPAIPRITEQFHTTTAIMQLTLNLFMLFSGVAQSIIGPLTDRYGRRPCCFILIALFIVGTTCCSFATGMPSLITGRLIQAFGSCGMIVLSFTIARDLYAGTKLAQCYSLLNGITSFSPMFAPFLGSYLDIHYGWQSTFEALLVIAVIALFNYALLLQETWPKSKRIPLDRHLFSHYVHFCSNPVFVLYTLAAAIGLSYLFIFCAISPVLIMTLLHVPEAHYGYYFGFMGVSFFFGSLFSAFVVKHLGVYKTVTLGFIITLTGGLLMALWYKVSGLTVYNFVLPMLLIGIGGTCSMGAGAAGSVEPYQDQAGLASSFSTALRFFFSALLGLLISSHLTSSLPLSIPAILFSLTGLFLFFIFKQKLKEKDNIPPAKKSH